MVVKRPQWVVKKVAELYVCERSLKAAPKYKAVFKSFRAVKWDSKVLPDPEHACAEKLLCNADWQACADLKQPYAKTKCLHNDKQKCAPLA